MQLRFQKKDLLAIAGVALLAVLAFAAFFPQKNATYAEIYVDGKLYRTVSLSDDQEFDVTGAFVNTVAVRDGKIAVIYANCPGEDCVSCGWQGDAGRSIVCLPNEMEIRIIGENDDVDFIVG